MYARKPHLTLAARAALLAITMLLVGAVGAQATVTVGVNGSTLTVTGSSGDDGPQFGYYNPATAADPGYTRIFDSGGVNDPLPAACSRIPDPQGQAPQNVVFCEDGGTATLLTHLVLTLGGGSDAPYVKEVCFDSVVVNLGDGNNTVKPPACPGGTFNITAGAGDDTVNDPDAGSFLAVTADLGAGVDVFNGGDGTSVVHAGPGDDRLFGGDGNDQLFGEGGSDIIGGYAGNDTIDGGADDDRLDYSPGVRNDADPGADDYRGGTGTDKLYLDNHAAGMTISIDEIANDGSPGEGDNIHNDIEDISGTTKADVFTGGPGADKFYGSSGDDTIHGAGGDDALNGGDGDDKVYGDAGNDKVEGSSGADTVDGGSGTDQIYGDIAGCSAFCSFDSDSLFARDGEQDRVDCGGGSDTAQVDGLDIVSFCASVDRQNVAAGGPPTGGGSNGTPGTTSPPTSTPPSTTFTFAPGATLSVAKGAGATVTCSAACSFSVSVVLSAATARKYGLGRKSLAAGIIRGTLPAAGSKKVTVKLSSKAKRKLKRAKKVPATLKVQVADAAGQSTTKTTAVTLGR